MRHVETLFSALLLASAMILAGLLLSVSGKGFDITDEAFNLLMAMYPQAQTGQVTWVGDLTQALWHLVGENLQAFRILGLILLLGSALAMTGAADVFAHHLGLHMGLTQRLCLAAATLAGSVMFYRGLYVLVPGYNWLAVIGLLGVQAGLFLLASGRQNWAVALVLGLSGYLTFAGKPSSGVAILPLALLCALSLIGLGRTLRMLPVAIGTAALLLIVHMIALAGGLSGALAEIEAGMTYLSRANSGHSLLEGLLNFSDVFSVTTVKVYLVSQKITLALTLIAAAYMWWSRTVPPFALALIMLVSLVEVSQHDIAAGFFYFTTITAYLLSFLVAIALTVLATKPEAADPPAKAPLICLIFGILLAASYVFGTNMSPANRMIGGGVFVAVPLVILARWAEIRLGQRGLVPVLTLAVIGAGGVVVQRGLEAPFRMNGPMSAQTEPVQFIGQSSPILLEPAQAAYARGIIDAANDAGWEEGTPLLQLTGYASGPNVFLNAPFIFMPNLLGGPKYFGGQEALDYALQATPRDQLDRAWLLTSEGGRFGLDAGALNGRGLPFPCGYRAVGRIPVFTDNFAVGSTETHILWKPDPSC
jgi:hypothetical protein